MADLKAPLLFERRKAEVIVDVTDGSAEANDVVDRSPASDGVEVPENPLEFIGSDFPSLPAVGDSVVMDAEATSELHRNEIALTDNSYKFIWTLREGDPTFRYELLNYSHRGHVLQVSNFKDDSSPLAWDCSAWVRTYALFLEERLECFWIIKYHIEAVCLVKISQGATKASQGRVSPDEITDRLMGILGHLVQRKTLMRNMKEMVEAGLSAMQQKADRFQQIKKEVQEMIRMYISLMKSKVAEQQDGSADDFQETVGNDESSLKEKYSMNGTGRQDL